MRPEDARRLKAELKQEIQVAMGLLGTDAVLASLLSVFVDGEDWLAFSVLSSAKRLLHELREEQWS